MHSLSFLSSYPRSSSLRRILRKMWTWHVKQVRASFHLISLSLSPFVSSFVQHRINTAEKQWRAVTFLAWRCAYWWNDRRWSRHSCVRIIMPYQSHRFCPITAQRAYVWIRLCLIVHDNNPPQCVQTYFIRWCHWLCVCVCLCVCLCVGAWLCCKCTTICFVLSY